MVRCRHTLGKLYIVLVLSFFALFFTTAAASPSPSPVVTTSTTTTTETKPAPAATVENSNLGEIALIITASFGGVAGILGAIAQVISVRRESNSNDSRDELIAQLLLDRTRHEDDHGGRA